MNGIVKATDFKFTSNEGTVSLAGLYPSIANLPAVLTSFVGGSTDLVTCSGIHSAIPTVITPVTTQVTGDASIATSVTLN